jgi:hypothetical protein
VENTKQDIQLFPNPVEAGKNVTVIVEGNTTLTLFDVRGTKIHSMKGANSIDFPIGAQLSAGTYLLHIETPTHIWNKQVVVR